jgi:uncharacterized repeat protein (TIGR03803 family)
MPQKRFPSLLESSAILVLMLILVSTAWAKPKYKILHGVPGGLFTGLTFDAKGNLYGGTSGGGDYNHGTIFQLTPGAQGWTLTTLHSFDGQDGGTPNGGLIFDAASNLYGTSPSGGTGYDGGNVFEMTPSSGGWTFNVLYNFCLQYHCPDGGNPSGGLIMDRAGNLYGGAGGGTYGDGVVFELIPSESVSDWNEQVLYDFIWKRGAGPLSPPIFDAAGSLYGTTFSGGAYGGGSVFRLKRASGSDWNERVLYSFCSVGYPFCKDGVAPYAGVVIDGSGNLYGTTTHGGGSACGETTCGTIFKLTPTRSGGWKHIVLYDFPSPANGSFPTGGVIIDKAGNLYGATVAGGIGGCSSGCGVAYKLTPGTNGEWKYTVLHRFNGGDGFQPLGGLILDGKGNLYGTAYSVVFEITP